VPFQLSAVCLYACCEKNEFLKVISINSIQYDGEESHDCITTSSEMMDRKGHNRLSIERISLNRQVRVHVTRKSFVAIMTKIRPEYVSSLLL